MIPAKPQLKKLLAQNQVQITIDILNDLTQHDIDRQNRVLLQSSRWHSYLEQTQLGHVDSRDLTVQFNQIHVALMDIIDNLGDDMTWDFTESFWKNLPKPQKLPHQKREKNPILFVFIGILGVATLIFSYFQKSNAPLSSVTVFVHEKGNKTKTLKRKQFYVVMLVRGEPKKVLLGEKGEAVFQNVKINEMVHLKIETSEPFITTNLDSSYVIPENGEIYLEVKLKGLESVFGNVTTEKDEPLEGVTVSINQLRTKTDSIGFFKITIPDSLQAQEQKVSCYKKGFQSLTTDALPQIQKALPIKMQRL